MRKNLCIFTVSIMAIFGVCGVSHAEIAAVDYVTQELGTKLDKKVATTDAEIAAAKNHVMMVGADGVITHGIIEEVTEGGKTTIPALSQNIQDKIYGALQKITIANAGDAIEDKAILLRKVSGDPADVNKTLKLNEDGTVVADWVSVPVGNPTSSTPSGFASIWVE